MTRFERTDQVVAYAGLDIEVKESGKWKGQAKLSKRGSGRLRRILYLAAIRCIRLPGSAFGAYYHRLVARDMKKRDVLMAVMRKMLIVAYRLLKTEESYDPTKVCAVSPPRVSATQWDSLSDSRSVFGTVKELLTQQGIVVTDETVRPWYWNVGQTSANELRRRRPRCGSKWHRDEIVLTIRGKRQHLWRTMDHDGTVLDILVQSRHNTKAAKRFFPTLLKKLHDATRVITPDMLKSSGTAKCEFLPGAEHRQHKGLNNRAENAHHPTWLRIYQ